MLITVKERKKMSKQKYWSGDKLESLEPNEVFVFGSNPVLSSYKNCPLYCPKLELE